MAAKKAKSKAWFTLLSPEIFGGAQIGKTMVSDPDNLVGRRINVSAVEVTNNFNKYYMKFTFRVGEISGDKARTNFDGSECMRDYISRMVVRHVKRIDTVQDLKTKDGVDIRVKGMAIVSKHAKSNTVKALRRKIAGMVVRMVQEQRLGDFIDGMMTDKLKGQILREIRTIYPVRNFEFRRTQIIR